MKLKQQQWYIFAKLSQHYIFAHIWANFRIYAEYAEMRTDAHQFFWRMASSNEEVSERPNMVTPNIAYLRIAYW